MTRIFFDYGHGGRDPGAVYKERRESMDNLEIGRSIAAEVRKAGIEVGESRKSDVEVSLENRVGLANRGKYDYFLSFHRNAFKPEVARGAEVFIYPKASPRARNLAQEVQKSLILCGFKSRGVKEARFYVLGKTKMPAILIELGFIDNSLDNELFDLRKKEIIDKISSKIIALK